MGALYGTTQKIPDSKFAGNALKLYLDSLLKLWESTSEFNKYNKQKINNQKCFILFSLFHVILIIRNSNNLVIIIILALEKTQILYYKALIFLRINLFLNWK